MRNQMMASIGLLALAFLPYGISAHAVQIAPPPGAKPPELLPPNVVWENGLPTNLECASQPISNELQSLPESDTELLVLKSARQILDCRQDLLDYYQGGDWLTRQYGLVQDLYSYPDLHLPVTLRILVREDLSDDLKILLVQLAGCAPIDSYLKLLSAGIAGYQEKQVKLDVLYKIIYSGDGWYPVVAMNYQNQSVRAQLERLLSIEEAMGEHHFEGLISDILSGIIRSRYVKGSADMGPPCSTK